MKTKLIIIFSISSLLISSCEKLDLEFDVPKCIEKEIRNFKRTPEGCQGASVIRYSYIDDFIYLFVPGECVDDAVTKYYDSDCNFICEWGGFVPPTNCNDLLDGMSGEAELVWTNK